MCAWVVSWVRVGAALQLELRVVRSGLEAVGKDKGKERGNT